MDEAEAALAERLAEGAEDALAADEAMMDQTQYYRWLDFATRMARNFPNATPARRQKIEDEAVRYIECKAWDYDLTEVNCWDGKPAYLCDSIEGYLCDHGYVPYDIVYDRHGNEKHRSFADQVICCVRAAFDLAVEPSAGVVGFEVGLLRSMYPEGMPDWITNWFDPPLTADVPDDMGAWL